MRNLIMKFGPQENLSTKISCSVQLLRARVLSGVVKWNEQLLFGHVLDEIPTFLQQATRCKLFHPQIRIKQSCRYGRGNCRFCNLCWHAQYTCSKSKTKGGKKSWEMVVTTKKTYSWSISPVSLSINLTELSRHEIKRPCPSRVNQTEEIDSAYTTNEFTNYRTLIVWK